MERVTANADASSGPLHNDSGERSKSDPEITPHEDTSPDEVVPHQEIELVTSTSTHDDKHMKRRHGQSLHEWIHVEASGKSEEIEIDKVTIMHRCNLSAHDLRLLEPSLGYPVTIYSRGKAILVRLDQIGCIITTDEALFYTSQEVYPVVLEYVGKLQRQLHFQAKVLVATTAAVDVSHTVESTDQFSSCRSIGSNTSSDYMIGNTPPDYKLPFELTCLDVLLGVASTFLQCKAVELEAEAYTLLDQFTNNSKIRIQNLAQLHGVKIKLVPLTGRVIKVRDQLEKLLDDDEDMALMHLTREKMRSDSFRSEKSQSNDVQEIQSLLEAYFLAISSTHNKLDSLKEYIDDSKDYMEI